MQEQLNPCVQSLERKLLVEEPSLLLGDWLPWGFPDEIAAS